MLLALVMAVTSAGIFSVTGLGNGGAFGLAPASTNPAAGSVVVGAFADMSPIPKQFWGVNVAATHQFSTADAAAVAATPVTYVRFPGGSLGEEFNYTSGVITSPNGAQSHAATSIQTFVASCKTFHCQAILQLPAEIDRPATAAYYASYVVNTLGYQPAYWEIGNAPSGWNHFGVPWSNWKNGGGGNTTPLPFANLVHNYITAILAVDPAAKFLALGAGLGGKNYAKAWVEDLAKVDGHLLAGISVHSYILGGPSNPSDSDLFANLNGFYSLPAQIKADRAYIKDACSSCSLQMFVSEINAAEDSSYVALLPSFAGTLYLAAEATQGLNLQASNLDWFAYNSHFAGSWSQHRLKWQMQYYLFSDIMTQLKSGTLPTTVTGPSTLYAATTYDTSGLALLMVNVATGNSVKVNLASSGFILGRAGVTEYSWTTSTNQPTKSTVTLSSSITLAPKSMVLLKVDAAGAKSPVNGPSLSASPAAGSARASSDLGFSWSSLIAQLRADAARVIPRF
jgi:hypothetical protein